MSALARDQDMRKHIPEVDPPNIDVFDRLKINSSNCMSIKVWWELTGPIITLRRKE